jgi:steroid 5-alpha reductase family enzyme
MAGLAAIPAVTTLPASADFALVLPYLSDLTPTLWTLVDAAKSSPADVAAWYLRTNPLLTGLIFSILLGFGVWVVSELARNYSQVDRLWSVLPFAYVLHFAAWARLSGAPSARLDLAALVIACWSARLTFNYWRKGGYSWGSEDYRWPAIKARIGPAGMFFMNATFISFVQSVRFTRGRIAMHADGA